jgi:hypothetical protein
MSSAPAPKKPASKRTAAASATTTAPKKKRVEAGGAVVKRQAKSRAKKAIEEKKKLIYLSGSSDAEYDGTSDEDYADANNVVDGTSNENARNDMSDFIVDDDDDDEAKNGGEKAPAAIKPVELLTIDDDSDSEFLQEYANEADADYARYEASIRAAAAAAAAMASSSTATASKTLPSSMEMARALGIRYIGAIDPGIVNSAFAVYDAYEARVVYWRVFRLETLVRACEAACTPFDGGVICPSVRCGARSSCASSRRISRASSPRLTRHGIRRSPAIRTRSTPSSRRRINALSHRSRTASRPTR